MIIERVPNVKYRLNLFFTDKKWYGVVVQNSYSKRTLPLDWRTLFDGDGKVIVVPTEMT